MPRHGNHIRKRADGRWEGRYKSGINANGTTKYSSVYAHSYAECAEKLANALNHDEITDSPVTVDELFDSWLMSRKNSVKQSTYVSYRSLYDSYLHESLGGYQAEKVTSQMINQLADTLLTAGGKRNQALSSRTVQAVLILLRSVLAYGSSEYRLENPARNIIMPKTENIEIQVFSDIDVKTIKANAIKGNCQSMGILLSLYTGIRIGELCALKWEDIDLTNHIIRINKTLCRIKNPQNSKPKSVIIITAPKSRKSIRDIPIPPFIIPKLMALRKGHQNTDYFLSGSQKYTEPRAYANYYRKFLQSISVEYRNFHVLRHTFATLCIRQGIDVKTLSELLGHSSVTITLEKYVHSDLEMKRTQLKKLYEAI